jgi:hypothetical protein
MDRIERSFDLDQRRQAHALYDDLVTAVATLKLSGKSRVTLLGTPHTVDGRHEDQQSRRENDTTWSRQPPPESRGTA